MHHIALCVQVNDAERVYPAAILVLDIVAEYLSRVRRHEKHNAAVYHILYSVPVGQELFDNKLLLALCHRAHVDKLHVIAYKARLVPVGRIDKLRLRQALLQVAVVPAVAEQVCKLGKQNFYLHASASLSSSSSRIPSRTRFVMTGVVRSWRINTFSPRSSASSFGASASFSTQRILSSGIPASSRRRFAVPSRS